MGTLNIEEFDNTQPPDLSFNQPGNVSDTRWSIHFVENGLILNEFKNGVINKTFIHHMAEEILDTLRERVADYKKNLP